MEGGSELHSMTQDPADPGNPADPPGSGSEFQMALKPCVLRYLVTLGSSPVQLWWLWRQEEALWRPQGLKIRENLKINVCFFLGVIFGEQKSPCGSVSP